jgi:type IX secretion system PorP/SprF family membrane protein
MRFLWLIILNCIFLSCLAQDVLFNQFLKCPTYTNPALTGTGKDTSNNPGGRVSSLYRNQWSLPTSNPYRTNFFGYDQMISDGFGSVGGYFLYDAAGKDGAFQTTQFNFTYGYAIPIDINQRVLRFGLSLGFKHLGVDFTKLKFEDQIDYTRGIVRKTDEIFQSSNDGVFDANLGLVYNNKNGFAGLSIHNVNPQKFDLYGSSTGILPRRYSLIFGNHWKFMESTPDRLVLQCNVGLFYQAKQMQLNAGCALKRNNLALGLGLRLNRSPIFNSDAAIVTMTTDLKNFNFYYGFEYTMSKIRAFAPVSHEIGIQIPLSIGKFYRQRYRTTGLLAFPF